MFTNVRTLKDICKIVNHTLPEGIGPQNSVLALLDDLFCQNKEVFVLRFPQVVAHLQSNYSPRVILRNFNELARAGWIEEVNWYSENIVPLEPFIDRYE